MVSWSDNIVRSQTELPYTINTGLQIRFPNPNEKQFMVQVNGLYKDGNQTTNQGLCFQVNNKTNNILINVVKHSYFYLRWSYNHLNTFLDSQSEVGPYNVFSKDGLLHDSGFIDISVSLLDY